MYKLISKLVLYRNIKKNSIMSNLCKIFEDYDRGESRIHDLTDRSCQVLNEILQMATSYGFDINLWQDYLTFLLLMDENPFSLTWEKGEYKEGTVNVLAKGDFLIIKMLFDFDFRPIEKELGIDFFTTISQYKALHKEERTYNSHVSKVIRSISGRIAGAADENEIFNIITEFYITTGVGLFGINKAFRYVDDKFSPINNIENVVLEDLVGYEVQKKELIGNTLSFVEGKPANNVLLYGDSGTGKSTSIKAVVNQFYHRGLRMIEVYKHQFCKLSEIISKVKMRNYRFIIYMDDLSFEEFEIEYKFLKAVIEGGAETRPDNVLIYATSNRRHIIRETWSDRSDISSDELHRSDTMQEKLSLVDRFGITINFSKPNRNEFFSIVTELASRHPDITLTQEELMREAAKWELWHGGMSGRTAQQFINYLLGDIYKM